ncbi:MAG: radical SAM protein [Pseudomonadota bacterium]
MSAGFSRLRRDVLADERGAASVGGDVRVGLLWPAGYETGMANLGFLWAWDALQQGGSDVQRYFARVGRQRFDRPDTGPPLSLEAGLPLGDREVIAVSIAAEADLGALVRMLDAARIPPLRRDRDGGPAVVAGGPLTRSNPAPLLAIADVVVWGDGEPAMARLVEALAAGVVDGDGLREAMAGAPGVLLDILPERWSPCVAEGVLPVVARVTTPRSAFPGMRLVEPVRGCLRGCAFCVCAGRAAPFRQVDAARTLAAIPEEDRRVGLVGAGIGDWSDLAATVSALADRSVAVGVSSLRVDRLDGELLDALVRAGTKTVTLALDGASDRLRAAIHKGVTGDRFLEAVEACRAAGVHGIKVYAMLGLPGEEDEDVDALAALLREAATRASMTLALSPFVPKRGTPLAAAPFASLPVLGARLERLRRGLAKGVRLSQVSPREAWVEHALSHAGVEDIDRIVTAARAGGRFLDWRRAFGD